MSHQDGVVLVVTAGALVVACAAGATWWIGQSLKSLKSLKTLAGALKMAGQNQKDQDPEHETGCARRAAHGKLVDGPK